MLRAGRGRRFGRFGSGPVILPIDPLTLSPSLWLSGRDLSTLFQDTAGTIPVTTVGQSIARINDKSGNGRHGTQSSGPAQPKLQQPDRYVFRLDGADDNFLTTLVPGLAGTLMIFGKPNAGGTIFMGGAPNGSTRCFISTNAGGYLGGGVGTQNVSNIFSTANIVGVAGVSALAYDGSTVRVASNGTKVYEGVQVGATSNAVPMRIGAYNSNGTPASWLNGDIYDALVFPTALSDANIAGVARYLLTAP